MAHSTSLYVIGVENCPPRGKVSVKSRGNAKFIRDLQTKSKECDLPEERKEAEKEKDVGKKKKKKKKGTSEQDIQASKEKSSTLKEGSDENGPKKKKKKKKDGEQEEPKKEKMAKEVTTPRKHKTSNLAVHIAHIFRLLSYIYPPAFFSLICAPCFKPGCK